MSESEQRIRDLEKRTFPSTVDPVQFLVNDAVFKDGTSKAIHRIIDDLDEVKKKQDKQDLFGHNCPVKKKFDSHLEKDFKEVRDKVMTSKWMLDLLKTISAAAVTFIALEFLKGALSL